MIDLFTQRGEPWLLWLPLNTSLSGHRPIGHIGRNTGRLLKNVPNFAMMLYFSTIEFKQDEIPVLKSNHSSTV